jgi:CheY-like chemotaxis protein
MNERPFLLFADRDLAWSVPLRKRLSQRGMRIATSSSARELLEQLQQFPRPDLIFMGDGLDELGGRLLGGLVQEQSPGTRIIRVLARGTPGGAQEPGPADNVLCSVSRETPAEELATVTARVLGCAPRRTLSTRPPLVVSVDDDEAFLRSLGRVLRRQGYRVLTYSDPELALEELPLVKPDLVIVDVLMPGLNGFEVLDEIRRYHPRSLPVLLLSALEEEDGIEEGRRKGASSYLTKSCPSDLLLETVRRLLAARAFAPETGGAGMLGPTARGR